MSEPSDEFITTKTCPACGKKFTVLWPHQWAYRRYKGGGKAFNFYCSWSCLRTLDREKDERKKKILEKECFYVPRERAKNLTQEQKDEAVRIALDGGDYLAYLSKTCKQKAPSNAFSKIKMALKKTDPEKYGRLQAMTVVGKGVVTSDKVKKPEAVAKAEIPEAPTLKVTGAVRIETPEKCEVVPGGITLGDAMEGMQDASDEFFRKCEDMGIRTEGRPKITKPVTYDGLTIREVEGGFGRWRRTDVGGSIYIDFEPADGLDTISLTVEQWRGFRKEREKAFAVLGVEA